MAIIRRVTRIANPRKAKARTRRKAVKARRVKYRRVTRNPVLLEFGVLNPRKKRRISVAKKRRKARRSSNPRRHAVARVHHRRRHHRRAVNRHHRRRGNPGMVNKAYVEKIGGALLGFGVVRALPAMIPTSITGLIPSTSFTPAIISGVATALATWAAHKFGGPNIAEGVALAGGVLTASQALNALGAPSRIGGFDFGVSGVGDIVATQGFSVPDRAMRAPVIPMTETAGVGRYGRGGYGKIIG